MAFIIIVSQDGTATLLEKEEWEVMVTRTDYIDPGGNKWIVFPHRGKTIPTLVKPTEKEAQDNEARL